MLLNLNILNGGSSITYNADTKSNRISRSIFFDAKPCEMETIQIGDGYICSSENHIKLYGKSDEKKELEQVSLRIYCNSLNTLSKKDKDLIGVGTMSFYKPSIDDDDFEYIAPSLQLHLYLEDNELIELKSGLEKGYVPSTLFLRLKDDDNLTYGNFPDGREKKWKLTIPKDIKDYFISDYIYCSEASFRFTKIKSLPDDDEFIQDKNETLEKQKLYQNLKINQIQNALYFIALLLIILLIK